MSSLPLWVEVTAGVTVRRLIVRSLKLITDLVINVYIIYVWAVNCKLAHQVCACKVY